MTTAPTDPRPLGQPLTGWTAPAAPCVVNAQGRYARIEPLRADRHAASLFARYDGHDWLWDYMPYGPFHSSAAYHKWVNEAAGQSDPLFLALFDRDSRQPFGVASYLRVQPQAGSIEVGHICVSPMGQRSRAWTEAMVLMMQWAFDAGYRRYEWKCDALNLASRRAAQRLGFSYEGVFRQAAVVKGRNRDTAWFAVTDSDWPALRSAFDSWLHPGNFDAEGRQIERLSDLTALVRVSSDPALR